MKTLNEIIWKSSNQGRQDEILLPRLLSAQCGGRTGGGGFGV